MLRPIDSVTKFIRYSVKARSGFGIHSPFVFHVYTDIIKNGISRHEYTQVERIRWEMTSLLRFIKRIDYGARSKEFICDQKFVRVRDVTRKSSISPKEGQLLFRLVRDIKPAYIVELGTSFGISTLYMALAARDSKVYTLEGCIDSANIALENFEKVGVHNINVITGKFEEKLKEVLASLPRLDMVFFDGNHKMEPTLRYFHTCLEHIHPETVFVFDDIHWSSGMEQAWNEIKNHPEVKITIDLFNLGIVYFRRELSKENFTLRF
jgi:predicted O-methyltransferase YrrM